MLGHPVDTSSRWLGHCVRDSRYCWCDTDSLAICANGSLPRFFVIEITLAAWDPIQDTTRPIFRNEYKKIYVRRNGYVQQIEGKAEIEALKNTNFNTKAENYVSLFEVSDTDFYSYDEDDWIFYYKINSNSLFSHFSKSQIFVQKFKFNKKNHHSHEFFTQIFLTIFLVKSKLQTA